ncbi:hypothetical protein [Saccharospirillum impatiens]|uniref:hypothetical protein n=1 Tax=Saccharospirillum impatiens TaxID=169438 RepID=UPI0012F7D834|nr:hypothetical protein [Saccharospirillum impatiens]
MNNKFRLCVFGCFAVYSSNSLGLDLVGAVPYDRGIAPRTNEQREASYVVYDVLAARPDVNELSLLALTNLDQGNEWYAFSREMFLYRVKFSDASYMSALSLTRWPTEVNDESLGAFTSNYSGDWYDYGLTLDTWVDRKGIGCLSDAPLRYGDIEDDGISELVLMLGDVDRTLDILVFSPEQETVTFGMRAAFQDSFPAEFPDKAGYEYVSEIDMRSPYPAERIYAKVFVGEFDGDTETTNELIVWRKRFNPYPVGSSNQGFYLDQSSFEHYVQVDEYQRQATDQATVQQWLASKNLRWPDGYPNVSECEGQEGELIPEMHDPLLNDPDVLQ